MQITSLVVASRQEDRAHISAILVMSIGTLSVVSIPKSNTGIWVSVPAREGIGTPCNAPEIRVVYRSWTFGFDSGIPRVTISGRSWDWTGSSGLQVYLRYLKTLTIAF
ncbi:hypothetical protein GQ457_04G025470 [Hibiscus cannabinus]